MVWINNDFYCKQCDLVFEELYKKHEEDTVTCWVCKNSVEKLLSAPKLGTYSMASPEQKAQILRQRSENHTAKELAKEPERFGKAGIQRYQQNKK